MAQKLERLGAVVVVLDVAKLSFTPRSSRVHFYKCNVANFEAVNEIYKKIQGDCGTPTILVANAGIVRGRTVLDATEADIRMTFDVNVLGVMWCLKVFLPAMIAADHGHVLITSSATAFVTVAGAVDYSASKAAVTSIYEGVQTELKNKYGNPRVQLSAIFPATIATKMFEGIEGGGGFLLPLLTPEGVAERMLQVLKKGERYVKVETSASQNDLVCTVLTRMLI